ncbi:unnamed protein product [Ectocarpus sp. 8 AP-2014]
MPDNDVILVATKCDLAGGNAWEIGRQLEDACRTWISSWVRHGMQPVQLEPRVSLTSCCLARGGQHGEIGTENHGSKGGWACDWHDMEDDKPPPSLLHRLVNKPDAGGLRGAQMVLPRSWDAALTVLEALEQGRDPVEVAIRKSPTLTEETRRKGQRAMQSCIRGSPLRTSARNGRKQLMSLSGEGSLSQTERDHCHKRPRMLWRELSLSRSSTYLSFATKLSSFWTLFGWRESSSPC